MKNFYFIYIGGKIKDLKHINPYVNLDGIDQIVEPFCGSCAFSLSHKDIDKFILNDLDKNLIDFLKDVKKGKLSDYIEYYNKSMGDMIENGKPTQKWQKMRYDKNLSLIDWYVVRRGRIKGGMCNLKWKPEKINDYANTNNFFKKKEIKLYNMEYKEILEKIKNDPKSFVFLDPPYLDSYNSSYENHNGKDRDEYNNIYDNTTIFIDIIEFLKSAKCKVMLIINGNAITHYIFKDFIKAEYEKRYDLTGRKTKHYIICNY